MGCSSQRGFFSPKVYSTDEDDVEDDDDGGEIEEEEEEEEEESPSKKNRKGGEGGGGAVLTLDRETWESWEQQDQFRPRVVLLREHFDVKDDRRKEEEADERASKEEKGRIRSDFSLWKEEEEKQVKPPRKVKGSESRMALNGVKKSEDVWTMEFKEEEEEEGEDEDEDEDDDHGVMVLNVKKEEKAIECIQLD